MTNTENRLADSMDIPYEIRHEKINGYDINYLKAGSGPPLLLIHGLNVGWGQWYPNIPEFAKHFTVYAVDLPGSGASTKIDFSKCDLQKDFADTAAEFVKEKFKEPVSIIGHSLGGWVAIKLALNENLNIKKIILVNSLGFSPYIPWSERLICLPGFAKFLAKTAVKLSTKDEVRRFLTDVMIQIFDLRQEFIDYLYENIGNDMKTNPLVLTGRFLEPFKIKKEFVMTNRLAEIKCPVLIVASDGDPHMPIDKIKPNFNLIPGAKVNIFTETGHVPAMEKAKEFNEIAIDFLRP